MNGERKKAAAVIKMKERKAQSAHAVRIEKEYVYSME